MANLLILSSIAALLLWDGIDDEHFMTSSRITGEALLETSRSLPSLLLLSYPFNIGHEYGRRRRREHASGYARTMMKKVTADYAQGILAGTRGGSPMRADADGERRDSTNWQGRDGRTLLLSDQMGGFCDSDAGWHVRGDGLRMSDGTSSSLAAGQNRLEQPGGTHAESLTSHLRCDKAPCRRR
ncbi:hypothetical protein EDD85DRAFT_1000256 [Armillaria nabsnona]|nr:hypothetical protein EDD85DRAFT_1000256 [Armillaria nabsnona]